MNGFPWRGRRNVVQETPLQLADRLPHLRADPRLVHTSEAQEPAGEAGVDATAEADREAAWEALRTRVHTANARVVAAQQEALADRAAAEAAVPKPMTVEEMVAAELDRRERERVAAEARAERERQRALAVGGPCKLCGATESWERDGNGVLSGKWYAGPTCGICNAERERWPHSTDEERRLAVVKRLLPQDVTKWWHAPYLLDKVQFRWWHETPGAVTSDRKQWAYVDTAAMIDALTVKPVEYSTREPCERCGCRSQWMWTRAYNGEGHTAVPVEQWMCKGCQEVPDLLAWVCRVIGLGSAALLDNSRALLEKQLDVAWWANSPAGGAADPPRPCDTPFGYVDLDDVRRRAFEAFPDERKWGSVTSWERARAAAQG